MTTLFIRNWLTSCYCVAAFWTTLLPTPTVQAQQAKQAFQSFSLEQLLRLADTSAPALRVRRGEEEQALAGITSARAYPNPEFELAPGRLSTVNGLGAGSSTALSIAQPIEMPALRRARLGTAQSNVDVVIAQTLATRLEISLSVKQRFFEVQRLMEEQAAFRDDLQLAEQIRNRVQLRVNTGEAPRFDLVRAEGELLVAQKNLDFTSKRLSQAHVELRRAVGTDLPEAFVIQTQSDGALLNQGDLVSFRALAETTNAEIQIAEKELLFAEQRLALERQSVLPQVVLRASTENDPGARLNRIGASVVVPFVNRREGPIAEAAAFVERNRALVIQRRFETSTRLEAAWQAYQAAEMQAIALQSGILEKARQTLTIAEAAYRLGERGILEFLDAQRQFRLLRSELIQARFARHLARVEIERLTERPQ